MYLHLDNERLQGASAGPNAALVSLRAWTRTSGASRPFRRPGRCLGAACQCVPVCPSKCYVTHCLFAAPPPLSSDGSGKCTACVRVMGGAEEAP